MKQSTPPSIAVAPLYLFAAARVRVPLPALVMPPSPLNGFANATALPLVSKMADCPLGIGAMLAEMSWVLPLAH